MSTINELKDKLDTKTLNFALLGLVTGSIYNILWMNKATQIIAESTKTKLVDNTYIIWVSVCLGMSYLLSGTGDEIVSILSGILTIASMVLHVVWAFKARAALTSYALNVSAPRSAPVFRTIRSSHLTSSFLHRGFSYDYATT